jgi:hypothetical protein
VLVDVGLLNFARAIEKHVFKIYLLEIIMRQLKNNEIASVSGAGLLTSVATTTVTTGVAAGTALGNGFVALGKGTAQAGAIVAQPLASATVKLLKFLI